MLLSKSACPKVRYAPIYLNSRLTIHMDHRYGMKMKQYTAVTAVKLLYSLKKCNASGMKLRKSQFIYAW